MGSPIICFLIKKVFQSTIEIIIQLTYIKIAYEKQKWNSKNRIEIDKINRE